MTCLRVCRISVPYCFNERSLKASDGQFSKRDSYKWKFHAYFRCRRENQPTTLFQLFLAALTHGKLPLDNTRIGHVTRKCRAICCKLSTENRRHCSEEVRINYFEIFLLEKHVVLILFVICQFHTDNHYVSFVPADKRYSKSSSQYLIFQMISIKLDGTNKILDLKNLSWKHVYLYVCTCCTKHSLESTLQVRSNYLRKRIS